MKEMMSSQNALKLLSQVAFHSIL